MSQNARPLGKKVRLGSEPPLVDGQPWGTLYGIRGEVCPGCGGTLWQKGWSPGRDVWYCIGPGSCGGYWLPPLRTGGAPELEAPAAAEPFVDASTVLF